MTTMTTNPATAFVRAIADRALRDNRAILNVAAALQTIANGDAVAGVAALADAAVLHSDRAERRAVREIAEAHGLGEAFNAAEAVLNGDRDGVPHDYAVSCRLPDDSPFIWRCRECDVRITRPKPDPDDVHCPAAAIREALPEGLR